MERERISQSAVAHELRGDSQQSSTADSSRDTMDRKLNLEGRPRSVPVGLEILEHTHSDWYACTK